MNTPILFLIFNRPDTTEKVFEAIRLVKPKYLFIAADGPRKDKPEDYLLCEKVREIVASNIDWDCEVKTLFRDNNLGCKEAVSSAINWFFTEVEYGIILEDDCLPNQSFFTFCEITLKKYMYNENISLVCGMNYLYSGVDSFSNNYFFTQYSAIWGWASWKRVITNVEWDIEKLKPIIAKNDFLKKYKGSEIVSKWLYSMIYDTFEKKINTWDTILFYNLILKNTQNIMPVKNQVSNIGIHGTHANNEIGPNLFAETFAIDLGEEMKLVNGDYYNKVIDQNIEKLINQSSSKNILERLLNRFF